MTNENHEPDWSLLPHDPIGFFGLDPAFDRGSLKRRYGQLIRRYKPEQHPTEFQQIRAAFENLEDWLRYRQAEEASAPPALQQPPQQNHGWTTVHSEPRLPEPALPEKIHSRLSREQPAALYRELAARSPKSADDYIALAVLSDVVSTGPGEQFADWIFRGIEEHRVSNSLHYLLQYYLRGPVPDDSLPDLLQRAARHVPEYYYFPQTERHWIKLLRTHGCACFRDTLAQCERLQLGKDIVNRVIFYVHILRHAIWEADAEWVQNTLSFVEEHFRYIPAGMDGEIDLLLELQKYAQVRSSFIERHPLRIEMDSVLRTFIAEGEAKGDPALRALQKKLLDKPQLLASAFPDPDEPTLGQFYSLWAWITLDAANRNVGPLERTPIDPAWNESGKNLSRLASMLLHWSPFGLLWKLKKEGMIALMVAGFFGIPILLTMTVVMIASAFPRNQQDQVIGAGSLVSITVGIFLAFRFWKYGMRTWVTPIDERNWPSCYRLLWQPQVVKFMQRTMLPVEDVMRLIITTSFINIRERLNQFIERDYALAFYALAQRFIA